MGEWYQTLKMKMKRLKSLFVLLILVTQIFAQTNHCPPIVEISNNIAPTEYSFKNAPKVQKTYVQEHCKVKHPKYTGKLYLYSSPEPYTEIIKEVRVTAVLDGCGNVIEVLKVDTVEVKQNTVSGATFGNHWTIRVEYLRQPAQNRPVGFMTSQLPDGNWITHYGYYNSAADAQKELSTIMNLYPQWCKMYVFKLPNITQQGIYYKE